MLEWMQCPNTNPKCGGIIVRATEYEYDTRHREAGKSVVDTPLPHENEKVWIAVPQRRATRPVDALVPEAMRKDYVEASLILDDSPRMSAVLSRRILADLLADYGGYQEYTLAAQIDKFLADPAHPSNQKENLHYLREIGDFSAHTKKDRESGEIVEVHHEEAEWTLDVVDRLFDYFIVTPTKDAQRRAAMDEKLRKAGRKPIQGRDVGDIIDP